MAYGNRVGAFNRSVCDSANRPKVSRLNASMSHSTQVHNAPQRSADLCRVHPRSKTALQLE